MIIRESANEVSDPKNNNISNFYSEDLHLRFPLYCRQAIAECYVKAEKQIGPNFPSIFSRLFIICIIFLGIDEMDVDDPATIIHQILQSNKSSCHFTSPFSSQLLSLALKNTPWPMSVSVNIVFSLPVGLLYFYIYLIFKNIDQLKNIAKDTLMKN